MTLLVRVVLASLAIVVTTFTVGPGTNVLTSAAFGVSLVILVFGGLYVLVWHLVGVVARRLDW